MNKYKLANNIIEVVSLDICFSCRYNKKGICKVIKYCNNGSLFINKNFSIKRDDIIL